MRGSETERERERGREGERAGGREREREGGREGGREREREGEREGGRGGRERESARKGRGARRCGQFHCPGSIWWWVEYLKVRGRGGRRGAQPCSWSSSERRDDVLMSRCKSRGEAQNPANQKPYEAVKMLLCKYLLSSHKNPNYIYKMGFTDAAPGGQAPAPHKLEDCCELVRLPPVTMQLLPVAWAPEGGGGRGKPGGLGPGDSLQSLPSPPTSPLLSMVRVLQTLGNLTCRIRQGFVSGFL